MQGKITSFILDGEITTGINPTARKIGVSPAGLLYAIRRASNTQKPVRCNNHTIEMPDFKVRKVPGGVEVLKDGGRMTLTPSEINTILKL